MLQRANNGQRQLSYKLMHYSFHATCRLPCAYTSSMEASTGAPVSVIVVSDFV